MLVGSFKQTQKMKGSSFIRVKRETFRTYTSTNPSEMHRHYRGAEEQADDQPRGVKAHIVAPATIPPDEEHQQRTLDNELNQVKEDEARNFEHLLRDCVVWISALGCTPSPVRDTQIGDQLDDYHNEHRGQLCTIDKDEGRGAGGCGGGERGSAEYA